MGLPGDNADGYRLGSPITFADQLQGNLLLVHGTGDDNCHYQGTEALINELLAKDSTAWADGGGKAKAILRPVFGQRAIAHLLLGVTRKLPTGLSGSIEEVNSAPALVAWNGSRLEFVSMVDVSDHHIQNLYTVRNPDKLVFLQRQLAKHSL